MRYSFIIPTLNEEAYLPFLLKSIQQQTEENEIIVVDANSTDLTKEIAKSFNAKVITTQKGVALQKNTGAKEAKGDYLIFIDADMILPKTFITDIEKYKFTSAIPITRIIPSQITIKDMFFYPLINLTQNIARLFKQGTGRGCFIIKKDYFPGFRNLKVCEDVDLYKRLKKVKHLPITVFEHPRRYRRDGYIKTIFNWTINGLLYQLNKPNKIKYKMIR